MFIRSACRDATICVRLQPARHTALPRVLQDAFCKTNVWEPERLDSRTGCVDQFHTWHRKLLIFGATPNPALGLKWIIKETKVSPLAWIREIIRCRRPSGDTPNASAR